MRFRILYSLIVIVLVAACKPSYDTPPLPVATTKEATAIAPEPTVLRDCSWQGTAKAWLDTNANSIWDVSEQPLANVLFFIDDTHNGYQRVGNSAVSNSKGEAELSVWLPGCPTVAFEVYTEAPASYSLTSPSRISVHADENGRTYQFGFAYDQSLPTATPRPQVSFSCESYSVKGNHWTFDQGVVTDMATAPDGAVWVTTNDNLVVRFDSANQKRTTFSIGDGIPDEIVRAITITKNGTVWLATNEGAARFDGSAWTAYTTTAKTGLSANQVEDIAIAPDGGVWFATFLHGVSILASNTAVVQPDAIPNTLLTSDYSIEAIRVSPTGSLWFFSAASIYQQTPAPESKWVVHKRHYDDKLGGLIALKSESSVVLSDDVLWLVGSTDDGISVVKLNPLEKTSTVYNHRSTGGAMIGDVVSDLAIAPDGSLWIGFFESGVMHFVPQQDNEETGTWFYYNADNGLLNNHVYKVIIAADGAIWMGGDAGFVERCVAQR